MSNIISYMVLTVVGYNLCRHAWLLYRLEFKLKGVLTLTEITATKIILLCC